MDWKKFIEPYFFDLSNAIRNTIVDQIVQTLPPTPTLETQQEMILKLSLELPKVVEELKHSYCNSLSKMSEKLKPIMATGELIEFQTCVLNLASGKSVPLDPENSSLLTGGLSSTATIIDHDVLSMSYKTDVIYEMWKYYRLNDTECIKLFPNTSHLTQDVSSEQFEQYYPHYKKCTRLFSKFITTQTPTLLSFCELDAGVTVIRRVQDTFEVSNSTTALGSLDDIDLGDLSLKDTVIVYLFDLGQKLDKDQDQVENVSTPNVSPSDQTTKTETVTESGSVK